MLPEKASMKQKFPETGMNYCGQGKHHWNWAKKVAGKGQQLRWSELKGCLHVPSMVMGGRSHQTLLHRQHGGSIQNLRRTKMLLMEHPNYSSLQHVVCTGWHSSRTLQEPINTLTELLPKIHYLSQKKPAPASQDWTTGNVVSVFKGKHKGRENLIKTHQKVLHQNWANYVKR